MKSRSLQGARCFVTGAASGIGRATAVAAARRGAVLFLTDVDAPGLEKAVAEIRAAGGTVAAHRALDISDLGAVRSLADALHAEGGSMDVLMNIAGISVWGAVEDLEHRHWRRAVEVDLMGPVHVIEAFLPEMIRRGRGGHLVNVSSAAGLFGLPAHAAYSAAKFGLRGVSEVLRFELELHHIDVTLVCPGAVDTGLVQTLEIAGIDSASPGLGPLRRKFQRRAVTPEVAAEAILRGVEERRYLVFTSRDVAIGYFFQTKLPFLYERAMRAKNRELRAAAATLRRAAPPAAAAAAEV